MHVVRPIASSFTHVAFLCFLFSSHLPSVENKGSLATGAAPEGGGGSSSGGGGGGGGSGSVANRPRGSYLCPRCRSAYCELPVECVVCGITLMSAPHLARAYHHLFPLPAFLEVPRAEAPAKTPKGEALCCGGCNVSLQMKSVVSLVYFLSLQRLPLRHFIPSFLSCFWSGLQVSQVQQLLLHGLRGLSARLCPLLPQMPCCLRPSFCTIRLLLPF